MRMVEEELKELELSLGQSHLAALVPDHATGRIQPQPMEFPDTAVPEIETLLVALHLGLDDLEVRRRSFPGGRPQICDVALHPCKDSSLELEEIGIDAHPVPRVFPARGVEVLTL